MYKIFISMSFILGMFPIFSFAYQQATSCNNNVYVLSPIDSQMMEWGSIPIPITLDREMPQHYKRAFYRAEHILEEGTPFTSFPFHRT